MASRLGKPWSCFFFTYPRALPALFLAGVLDGLAGLAADVLAADATGARALLTESDFGFAGAFFAAAFLAGFGVSGSAGFSADFSVVLADFFGAAFFAARLVLPPPLAARSSISAMASASLIVSGVLSLVIVALTPPAVT